jgi:hypothetical protein
MEDPQEQSQDPGQEQQAQQPQASPQPSSLDDALAAKASELNAAVKAAEPAEAEAEVEPAAPVAPEKTKQPDVVPKAHLWASLRKQQQDLVQKQQSWSREKEAQLAELKQWNEIKQRAKDDPFTALRMIGWEDGKEFITHIANTGGSMTPEQKRIHQLEQDNAAFHKQRAEQEQQRQQEAEHRQTQQALDNYHQTIAKYIKETPEFSESLVSLPGSEGAVYQVMDTHYRNTGGEVMEYRDAVKQVQQYQEQQLSELLTEVASNKRGLAILKEFATKLNRPAQASQKAPGITQRISNQTGAKSRDRHVPLDDKLALAAKRLNEQFG